MQIKIIEDESIEETSIIIHCKKQDEELQRMIARMQLQDKKIMGCYRGEHHLLP